MLLKATEKLAVRKRKIAEEFNAADKEMTEAISQNKAESVVKKA